MNFVRNLRPLAFLRHSNGVTQVATKMNVVVPKVQEEELIELREI